VKEVELTERLEALREEPAFAAYARARDEVLRMKELETMGAGGRPSAYWREELEGFDYMLDASPLIVDRLRRHSYHVTGIHAYDYRSGRERQRRKLAEKLTALRELGHPDLLVPESPALGGFGFEVEGGLYNIDTLKFFEVLIAMERGGVLAPFREGTERNVVWEIGGGWGGFAYQFKTLFPNTTYVIVDLPELFLFSGTYLETLFPDARVAYATDEASVTEAWTDADFILMPNTMLDVLRPDRLDLTVNMVSFQEMTTEQVRAYVETAARLGSRHLYSLNRDRSGMNAELSSVSEVLAERYETQQVEVLDVAYTKMLPEVGRPLARAAGTASRLLRGPPVEDAPYRHLIGRLR